MGTGRFTPAAELARLVRDGRVRCRTLVEEAIERIAAGDGEINAVVTLDVEGARQRADALDAAAAPLGPLHGVPITLKDSWATAGIRTTAGTREMADHVPDADAVPVARLVAAGAVVLGKTNLPAGASGQETANELFGRTCNPWDLSRTCGASSGGAAAAVAAGFVPLELGSDLGGSIRQPSHYCGVFGHYPTHGVVPVRGHLPSVPLDDLGYQSDLLAAGPIARSAGDLSLALDVLAGPDEPGLPAWRITLPPARVDSLRGLRVAAWLDDPACPVSSDVGAAYETMTSALARAGAVVDAEVRPVDLAVAREIAFALWVAGQSDSSDDASWAAVAHAAAALHPDDESLVAQRLRAEAMSHREWLLLDAERRRLERAWGALSDDYDVILCPVAPVVAPPHDPAGAEVDDLDHRLHRTLVHDGRERPYLDQVVWNTVVGMARLPSTVAPVGTGAGGLPVGVQVVGPRYADHTTIAVAGLVNEATGGWRPPPLT